MFVTQRHDIESISTIVFNRYGLLDLVLFCPQGSNPCPIHGCTIIGSLFPDPFMPDHLSTKNRKPKKRKRKDSSNFIGRHRMWFLIPHTMRSWISSPTAPLAYCDIVILQCYDIISKIFD